MEQPTYHYARENPPCPVPSLDGYVIVESSDVPVPYHITSCGAGSINAAQGHSLAVSSARIACMSADIMRGTAACGQAQTGGDPPVSREAGDHGVPARQPHAVESRAEGQLRYLPVVPRMMSG